MSLFLKPNPSSGMPIYLQLKEQIRHAVETGALRPGDSLPAIRAFAEQLVVNANTIARVYRELEQEGLLDLRHGVGAFVAEFGVGRSQAVARAARIAAAQSLSRDFVRALRERGVSSDEIRRLVEAELENRGAATETPPTRPARPGVHVTSQHATRKRGP